MLQKLLNLINNTVSGSNEIRVQAEKSIEEFSKTNLDDFLNYLSEIISSSTNSVYIRQLSLILISNAITAKNQYETQSKLEAWLHLDFNLRNKVKQAALSCLLQQEDNITRSGASLFAKITKIELVSKSFNDSVLISLINNVSTNNQNIIKSSILQLEYIIEETEELLPEDLCNKITESCLVLNRKFEANFEPQIISLKTNAFSTITKALPFSSSYMISNISTVLSISLEQLQKAYPLKDNKEIAFEFNTYIGTVFECLISCIEIYSDCLTSVLGLITKIFETTSCFLLFTYHAFDTWSCLIENSLYHIYQQNQNLPIEVMQFKKEFSSYLNKCIELVVVGLEYYNEEEAIEEEFNDNYYGIKQAASVCFDKLNILSKKKMFTVIGNYVNSNFKIGSEINKLESSVISIGLLIKNQPKKFVFEWAKLQVPILYEILAKHNEIISESQNRKNLIKSTLWCFQKLINRIPDVLAQTNLIGYLLEQCTSIISCKINNSNEYMTISIYNNACVLILNILEGIKRQSIIYVLEKDAIVNTLELLIKISESVDVDDATLVESAFNTMIALISCSPGNKGYSKQLAQYLLNRCANTLQNANSINDNTGLSSGTCYSNISSCLATFQTIIITDELKELSTFIPPFTELLSGLLNSKDTGLYEEAFFSIGAVLRYYQHDDAAISEIANHFHKKIIDCINNFEEIQNCKAAIVTLGDLSHALGEHFANISDQCVSGLMNLLLNNNVDSSVKPVAIECLADLSMVLKKDFEKYLTHVTPIIVDASKVNLNTAAITEEFFESLSVSVLETSAAFLYNSSVFISYAVAIAENYLQCELLNYTTIDKLILLLKVISDDTQYVYIEFNISSAVGSLKNIIDRAKEVYGNNNEVKHKFNSLVEKIDNL